MYLSQHMNGSFQLKIRPAIGPDLSAIQAVHQQAFGPSEGENIAQLVADMVSDPTAQPLLSLLAEDQSRIIGSILFTPVRIEGAEPVPEARILAPLGVLPAYQNSGVGTALIQAGLRQLDDDGVNLVFVYGDPNYYSRTGFEPAIPRGLDPPHPIDDLEGWMVQSLSSGATDKAQGTVVCCASLSKPEIW